MALIGVFFLVLAVIFAFGAWTDYRRAERQWSPAAKTRRRIAMIFGIVGLGLLLAALSGAAKG